VKPPATSFFAEVHPENFGYFFISFFSMFQVLRPDTYRPVRNVRRRPSADVSMRTLACLYDPTLQAMTGDNWSEHCRELMTDTGQGAYVGLFYVSFMLVVSLVLVNVVIAVRCTEPAVLQWIQVVHC